MFIYIHCAVQSVINLMVHIKKINQSQLHIINNDELHGVHVYFKRYIHVLRGLNIREFFGGKQRSKFSLDYIKFPIRVYCDYRHLQVCLLVCEQHPGHSSAPIVTKIYQNISLRQ